MKKFTKAIMFSLIVSSCMLSGVQNVYAGHTGSAVLQITLNISEENRSSAVSVYQKYKQPFLTQVPGAVAKELLIRENDVQVLHEFKSTKAANIYLASDLFQADVVRELKPLLNNTPEIRVYEQF